MTTRVPFCVFFLFGCQQRASVFSRRLHPSLSIVYVFPPVPLVSFPLVFLPVPSRPSPYPTPRTEEAMLPVARYTPRRRAVVLWRRHLSAVPRCLLLTWCPTPSPAVAARWRWRGVAGGAGGRVGWAFGMIASPFDANVSPPLCWLAPGAPHRLLRASGVSRSIGPHHTVRAPGVVEEEGVRALTPLVSPSLLPPPPPPPLLPTAGWRHSPPAVAVTAPPPIPPAARAVAAFQRRQPVAATGQGRHSVGPPRSLEGRTFGKAAPGPPPATAGRRTRGSVAPAATPPACEQRAADRKSVV